MKLYAIGIGPGDKELLTVKAARLLGETQIVFCPQSEIKKESLALSICQDYINPKAKVIRLVFPMTKDQDELKKYWSKAVETIIDESKNKQMGVFVTLGDPAIYSTYNYIADSIKNQSVIEFTTIPGITAFSASAAALDISLVEANEKLALLTATDIDAIENAIDNFDTIVLYKINKHLPKIIKLLKEKALEKNSYLISRVTSADESIDRLDETININKSYFSTLIIKKGQDA